MCGIAGILSTAATLHTETARQTLNAMQSALAHRGPDANGQFFSLSGHAALAHNRLSIIDLSNTGHQPMSSSDQRYTIIFNGEIYNYQTLKAELESHGEQFASHSDTEVLLRLYQREGENCVNRLRGMFAFLIWDEETQSAFAARDPLGIKPFYFSEQTTSSSADQSQLAFASEIRSLLKALPPTQRTICSQGLSSYLLTGTVAEPHTMLESISMLPAGHTLSWQDGNTAIKQYWQLEFDNEKKSSISSREDAIQITRAALESTVKAHFVSDVPVGIFLSGGIDSTALVALASKVTNSTLNTYSIAFEDPAWDEGDIAARVAQHFDTNHTEFLITPEIAKPLFSEFLSVVDQPTIDGFNTFCVSKMAQQAGEKVVLSGVGGDELFAGYKSFEMLPKMHSIAQKARFLSPIFKGIQIAFYKMLPSKLLRSLDFIAQPQSLSAAHQSLRGIFSIHETKALCHAYQVSAAENVARSVSHPGIQNQISELELTSYMRNQLLRDSDVMSMACSLELRVPFVDRVFIDSISQIPASIRLKAGKKLLVDAVPELPEWVVNRPKQGFRFPFDAWFSAQWSELPQPKHLPNWIKLTPWYRRWSVLVLNHWLDQYCGIEQSAQSDQP